MRFYLLLLTLLFSTLLYSQNNSGNLSFAKALKQAAAEGKLVMVQFESTDCVQCNETADKGMADASIQLFTQQTFVHLKINKAHPDRAAIGQQYNIGQGFGLLFLNHTGTLIHNYRGSTSRPITYKEQMDLALTKAGESLKVDELEKAYANGNKSVGVLEMLLDKKKMLNLSTDELLEEYVSLLPADSLQSVRTLVFIAEMAPLLGSNASNALRKDRALFDQAWSKIQMAKRGSLNSIIIHKSMQKAIANKDEGTALKVASFAASTYGNNREAGYKALELNMMRYFDGVRDTAQYFGAAVRYYDKYLMSINADSVKRLDSLSLVQARAQAPKRDTIKDGKPVQYSIVGHTPIGQRYTYELNEAAWKFYNTTSNPSLLATATAWAERGLQFYESPEALDTYARLLYKQGKPQKAIEVQTKAVSLRKQRGFPTATYDAVLERMKAGAVVID